MRINTLDHAPPALPIDELPMFGGALAKDAHPALFDEPTPTRPIRLATIVCVVCGHEARIPILRAGKLCDVCNADPVLARSNIEADMERAHTIALDAEMSLNIALVEATEADRARYDSALALKAANDPRITAAWAKALIAGDGLAALLAAHDAQLAAEQALTQAVVRGGVALAEIERVAKEEAESC